MSRLYDEPASGVPIATDTVAGEDFELYKILFGTASEAKRVSEALPLPSRDWHGGTIQVDTGLVPVVQGAAAFVTTGVDHFLDVLLLSNRTEQIQAFAFTDGLGNIYGGQDLAPKEVRVVPLYGLRFLSGVKMGADAADSVFCQVKGTR